MQKGLKLPYGTGGVKNSLPLWPCLATGRRRRRLQRLPPLLLRLERAGAGGMDTGHDLGATAWVSELRYGAPLEPAPVPSAASHCVTFTRNAVGGERHLPHTAYPGPCLVRATQADLPRVVLLHISGDQVIKSPTSWRSRSRQARCDIFQEALSRISGCCGRPPGATITERFGSQR